MAWTALFKTELQALTRSWVLRGWLIALALTEFFILAGSLQHGLTAPPASAIVTAILNLFLFAWSIVIIVLGAGSVSLGSDVISDSILSRPCTRTQFISAKFASRTLVVLGVYLASALTGGFAAWRYGANDMTPSTFTTGVCVVGLAVLMLLSLGILFSVVFNNTVMAVASLMLVWYVASSIFGFLGAEYLSPFALSRNLQRMLKDQNAPQLADAKATLTGINLAFSKPLDSASAEQPGNYVITSTDGTAYPPQTAVYDKPTNGVVLAGLTLPPGAHLSVNVRNVTDEGGVLISPAANNVEFDVPNDVDPGLGATSTGQSLGSISRGTLGNGKSASGRPEHSASVAPAVKRPGDNISPRILQCVGTPGSVKLTFSKPLNVKDAEQVENYVVECPPGKTWTARAATYSPTAHTVLLSGFSFSADDPVKVTVKHVRSESGVTISPANGTAQYAALTTWKYLLGLGAPSLLAFFIAVQWFARRDL